MGLETVAIVCFVVVLWWRLWLRPPEEELPPELRGTRLVYAERLFRSLGPVSITAKVDRVYRKGGSHGRTNAHF